MVLTRTIAAVILFSCSAVFGAEPEKVVPLVHGSVHRDQDYPRPLLDSLDLGFCSVEVDVHLVGDKLLVGHDPKHLRPDRTFQSLYLDPLLERSKRNGGRIYPDVPGFMVLIDIKTEGRATYAMLRKVLAEYAEMLTVIEKGKLTEKAVTAILSGNVPQAWDDILADSPQYGSIDGRLVNLDSDLPAPILPLISDHWGRHFKWRGVGPMPEAEKAKLINIVQKSHQRGRRLRFWATPENPDFWKQLRACGVDLINTDKPNELKAFLTEEQH